MNDNVIDKKELRYDSFKSAFERLKETVNQNINISNDIMSRIIIDATIQRFEFTFELMWKVIKDYLENVGFNDFLQGPKGVLQFAFKNGMLHDEKTYSDMLKDRNSTTHLYDEKLANKIYVNIKESYVTAIEKVIYYLEKEEYLK